MMRIRESLLPWKSNTYYIPLPVCERVSGRVGLCMRMRACSLTYPAFNAYAPYCNVIYGPTGSTIFFDIIS